MARVKSKEHQVLILILDKKAQTPFFSLFLLFLGGEVGVNSGGGEAPLSDNYVRQAFSSFFLDPKVIKSQSRGCQNTNIAVFFTFLKKAFDPSPLPFEHLLETLRPLRGYLLGHYKLPPSPLFLGHP